MNDLIINGLQHVGLPVTDIRVSEKFYGTLGFANVMEAPFEHPEGTGTCIMMQRDQMVLELYQMPGKALDEIRKRRSGHIDHIAFDVSDIEKTYSLLRENGYNIVEDAPVFLQFWKNGVRFFNIFGPDGERLEFNQIL